jgi:transposase
MDDAHTLPTDLAECQRLLLATFQRAADLSRVLEETAASYAELQTTRQAALEELSSLKRWIYGRRTEKLVEGEGQRHLFDLELSSLSTPPLGLTPELPSPPTAPRRRRRELDLDKLPHYRHEHDLSAADKQCSGCGRAKDRIGQDESRILEYVPAKFEVHVYVRTKYACRCCQDGVASPPPPVRPVARGIAGPGLIAQIVAAKFGDHLPLYRQEDFFTRHGLHIARSTQCDWVQAAAELLRPLYERQKELLLQSSVLWTDDTPVTVLSAGPEGSRTGRFWTYIADEHPYSVYDFTESRARDGPASFLRGFEGYLHADAYGGYDQIYLGSNDAIREVACWARAPTAQPLVGGASSSTPSTARHGTHTRSWSGSDNGTTSRSKPASYRSMRGVRFVSPKRCRCWIASARVSRNWKSGCCPKACLPRLSLTPATSGKRSVATSRTVGFRSTTTSANEHSATRRSGEKTGCSWAASKRGRGRPSYSRSSPAPSDIGSSPGPICVSSCSACTTTIRVSTRCCPIVGPPITPSPRLPIGSKKPAARQPHEARAAVMHAPTADLADSWQQDMGWPDAY